MTTSIIFGSRVSRQGKVRLGCSAVLFDRTKQKVLLTRRTDNGLWCLPGGMVDSGETVAECCEREVLEETGLKVRVVHLTEVYSDPDQLIVYPDDNRSHSIVLGFLVEQVGGKPRLSNETSEIRFFPVLEAIEMPLFHGHAIHIRDALAGQDAAYIR